MRNSGFEEQSKNEADRKGKRKLEDETQPNSPVYEISEGESEELEAGQENDVREEWWISQNKSTDGIDEEEGGNPLQFAGRGRGGNRRGR